VSLINRVIQASLQLMWVILVLVQDDGRPKTNDRLGHQSPVIGHFLPFVPLFVVTMLSQENR
jgi:hypothetical protein